MFECPNCHSRDIGKIGSNHYYCWNCFIELTVSKDVIHVHQVEEDGSLSSLDDLFDEKDRIITTYNLKENESDDVQLFGS